MALPRRLQHQRQYETIRSVQLAERDAAVPDRPVVEERPASALSHAHSRKEQIRLDFSQLDPRVQSYPVE